MIWGIIIFLVTLIIDLYTDVKRYLNKKRVNHVRGALLRLIGLVPASWLMGWAAIPMLLFAYWVFFEGFYNIAIGQKWGYIGNTAWLDKQQRKYTFLKFVKYIGLILSILLYYAAQFTGLLS